MIIYYNIEIYINIYNTYLLLKIANQKFYYKLLFIFVNQKIIITT